MKLLYKGQLSWAISMFIEFWNVWNDKIWEKYVEKDEKLRIFCTLLKSINEENFRGFEEFLGSTFIIVFNQSQKIISQTLLGAP